MITCDLSKSYSTSYLTNLLTKEINNKKEQWNSDPYSIVFNLKKLLRSFQGKYKDEWFNQEMGEVFPKLNETFNTDKIFDPYQLEEYEKGINNQASNPFNKFKPTDGLNGLFKNSSILSGYFLNKAKVELLNSFFINKDAKLFIKNNSDLNKSIISYKNKLFADLKKYLGILEDTPLYNEFGESNNQHYLEVLNLANNDEFFNKQNFEEISLNKDLKLNKLNPYYSFITLLNFDKFIKELYPKTIEINSDFIGSLNLPVNGDKYKFSMKGEETTYWKNDTLNAYDPKLSTSLTAKTIVETIPYYNANGELIPDTYFGMDKLLAFAGEIKNYELKNGKSFRDNPRQALLDYLSDNYKNIFTTSSFYSLKNYIDSILEIENNEKKVNTNGVLSDIPNIIDLITWEIDKSFAPSYLVYGDETKIINMSEYDKSNGKVRDLIFEKVKSTNKKEYAKRFYVNSLHSKNLSKTLATLEKDLGFIIDKETFKRFSSLISNSNSLDIVAAGLNEIYAALEFNYDDIVSPTNEYLIDKLNQKFSKISPLNHLMNAYLNNLVVSKDNVLIKEGGDAIAVNRAMSLGSNDATSIKDFNLQVNNPIKDNIGFLKGTAIRLEVVNSNAIEGRDTISLNASESIVMGFHGDFLSHYKNGLFLTQPVPYSDKNSEFVKIFDIDLALNIGEGKKSIKIMSNKELISVYHKNFSEYYKQALEKVVNDIAKIYNVTLTNNLEKDIETINKGLSNKTANDLFRKTAGTGVEIVEGLHFVTYSDGKNKFLQIPRTLIHYYNLSKDLNAFTKWNLKNSLDNIKQLVKHNTDYFNRQLFKTKESVQEIKELSKSLNATDFLTIFHNKELKEGSQELINHPDKINIINKLNNQAVYSKAIYLKVNGMNIDFSTLVKDPDLDGYFKKLLDENAIIEINPIIERFNTLTNYTKDAYLQINIQAPYLYGSGGNINRSLEEEESSDFEKMSKRTVHMTSTIQNYQQGLDNGIPAEVNIIQVEDPTCPMFSYMGHDDNKDFTDQDVDDGSARGSSIMHRLEENSLPGLGIKGTQKPFYATVKPFVVEETKFAKFPITNKLIRDSLKSDNKMALDNRRMHDVLWKENGEFLDIDLSRNYLGKPLTINNISKSLNKDFYYVRNGKYYKIGSLNRESFSPTEGSIYEILVIPVDSSGVVSGESFYDYIKINSLYDLWNAFGGANSQDLINGKLDFSETSFDVATTYTINVGTFRDGDYVKDFPLKSKMYSMVVRPSAQKVGKTNVNTLKEFYELDELGNFKYDTLSLTSSTKNFGIQLDPAHEADESDLTEPTQVISGAASSGNASEIVDEMYKDLSELMKKSMKETLDLLKEGKQKLVNENNEPLTNELTEQLVTELKNAPKEELNKVYDYLAKWTKKEFKNARVIGVAQASIEAIQSETGLKIPFSSPSIYGLFITNLFSSLNRNTLRRRFAGLGLVLNPSHGVVKMFNFKGKRVFYTDIFKEAIEFVNSPEYNNELGDFKDDLEMVERYMNFENPPVEVNSRELQLLDSYLPIFDESDGSLEFIASLENPVNSVEELMDELQQKQMYEAALPSFIEDSTELKNKLTTVKEEIDTIKNVLDYYTKPKTITTPKQLQELHDQNIKVWQVNEPTDLKPDEITWEENEIEGSVYSDVEFNEEITGIPVITEVKKVGKKYEYADYKNGYKLEIKEFPDAQIYLNTNSNKIEVLVKNQFHVLPNLGATQKEILQQIVPFLNNKLQSEEQRKILATIDGFNLDIKPQKPQIDKSLIPQNVNNLQILGTIKKSIWTTDALRITTNLNNLSEDQKVIANSYVKWYRTKFNKALENKTKVRNSFTYWIDATLSKLNDKKNLLPLSAFKVGNDYNWDAYFESEQDILNYKYKKAEIILPRVYESALNLKGVSMYEVDKQGIDFFKNRLQQSYNDKSGIADFLLRLKDENLEVKVGDIKSSDLPLIKEMQFEDVVQNGETVRYRLDSFSNRMYKIPVGTKLLLKNNTEVLVIPFDQYEDFISSFKNKLLSLEVLGGNRDFLKLGKKLNQSKIYKDFYNNLLKEFKPLKKEDYEEIDDLKRDRVFQTNKIKERLQEFKNQSEIKIEEIARLQYTSFLKMKEVISARIPSQDLQSFMSMNTVGFSDGGSNDGYVSIWQIYLQGSDFDVDKAYTILNSLNDVGIYQSWSPLFDFSSKEALDESEQLPKPNGIEISEEDGIGFTLDQINNYNDLTDYVEKVRLGGELNITDWVTLLNSLDYNKPLGFLADSDGLTNIGSMMAISDIIEKINEHNAFNYSNDSIKNKVKKGIERVIEHPKNLLLAHSPISMGVYKNIYGKVKSSLKNIRDGNVSLYEIKEANQDGKGTVGIMANGLKSFFALTQYYNTYYKTGVIPSVTDPKYFQKTLDLLGKKYTISTISDINLNVDQKTILTNYLKQTFENSGDNYANIDLLFNEDNASLNLSALTSLATDNAKELGLAKLNAGIQLAAVHVYMTILGLSPEIISDYMMTSPEVLDIKSKLNANIFIGYKSSVDKIVEKTPAKYPTFIPILRGARELRSLNSFLKLNQGTKSDVYEVHDLIEQMKETMYIAESRFTTKDGVDYKLDINQILQDKPYLNEKYIRQILNQSSDIIFKGVDFFRFIQDLDYKNKVINYYNLIKDTVNVFDVVSSLPHFNGMLESLIYQIELAKESSKFNFVENEVSIILNNNKGKISDMTTINSNPNAPVIYKKEAARKAANLFDEYIISEFFKQPLISNKFKFNLANFLPEKGIVEFYHNGEKKTYNNGMILTDMEDLSGIMTFKLLMENNIIPYFKTKYPDNEFFKNLLRLNTKNNSKYRLNVSTDNLSDPIFANKLEIILNGFDSISDLPSDVVTTFGQNVTFGDLFFAYNLIVNKMKALSGSLSIVFQNYAKSTSSLNHKFNMLFNDYDEGLKTVNINEDDLLFALYNKGTDTRTLSYNNASKSIEIPKKDYIFNVGVANFKTIKSSSKIVNNIEDLIKNNLLILELDCDGM